MSGLNQWFKECEKHISEAPNAN